MKRKISLILALFCPMLVYSQSDEGIEISLEQNKLYDVQFEIYTSANQIIKKIDAQEQSNFSNPEGVIQSLFSATNQAWLEKNYFEPEFDKPSRDQNTINFIKKMDKNKNWVTLIDKFSFVENGVEVAMVLYLIHYDGQPFKYPTVLTLQKHGARWYIGNLPNKMELTMTILQLKPTRLQELLKGDKTGNTLTDEVISKTRNKGNGLDIKALYDFLVQINENKNSEMLNHLINK